MTDEKLVLAVEALLRVNEVADQIGQGALFDEDKVNALLDVPHDSTDSRPESDAFCRDYFWDLIYDRELGAKDARDLITKVRAALAEAKP